ncbi:MAG: Flp family type IVb pilin [Pseudomonadota bacterium]
MFTKFLKDESGATAIEYTLLAALIGVAIIGSLETLEAAMNSKLKEASDAL